MCQRRNKGFGVRSSELKKSDSGQSKLGYPSCIRCNDPLVLSRQRATSFRQFSLFIACCIILLASLGACSATYRVYANGMFNGQRALAKGDYEGARWNFEKAYEYEQDPVLLTYLAVVNYKTNNLADAERLIREAEWRGANDVYHLRTIGYKALILLKQDHPEGMDALSQYLAAYALRDPLMTIHDVDGMRRSGAIDMVRLEKLIEDQVSWYEGEIEQYLSSGTGFYDGKYSGTGSFFRSRGGIFYGR